jgi:hypothetical protein
MQELLLVQSNVYMLYMQTDKVTWIGTIIPRYPINNQHNITNLVSPRPELIGRYLHM